MFARSRRIGHIKKQGCPFMHTRVVLHQSRPHHDMELEDWSPGCGTSMGGVSYLTSLAYRLTLGCVRQILPGITLTRTLCPHSKLSAHPLPPVHPSACFVHHRVLGMRVRACERRWRCRIRRGLFQVGHLFHGCMRRVDPFFFPSSGGRYVHGQRVEILCHMSKACKHTLRSILLMIPKYSASPSGKVLGRCNH